MASKSPSRRIKDADPRGDRGVREACVYDAWRLADTEGGSRDQARRADHSMVLSIPGTWRGAGTAWRLTGTLDLGSVHP